MIRLELTLCEDDGGDGDFDHKTVAGVQVIADRISIQQMRDAISIFMTGGGYEND